MAIPVAAAAAGASSANNTMTAIGGSLINAATSIWNNRKNIKAQQQENEKNRQFQVDMWNKQNAYNEQYNSPQAQMQRLKDANINPHMAYMGANATMQASPVPSSSGTGDVKGSPIINPLDVNAIQNATMLESQKNLMDAQADNLRADAESKRTSTQGQILLNGITQKDLDTYDIKLETLLSMQKSGINVNEQNIKESEQRITNLLTQNDEIKQRIENLLIDQGYTKAQTAGVYKLIALQQSQIEVNKSNIEVNKSTIKEKNSNVGYNNEYIKLIKAQTESQSRANDLTAMYGISEKEEQLYDQKLKNYLQKNQGVLSEWELQNYPIDKTLNTIKSAREIMKGSNKTP